MTRIIKTTILLLLVTGLCGWPSRAQQTQQKSDASKAVPSSSQIVLAQWNEIGRKLIAMAEDFPEDKYDFKATPAVRSFAEQLLHAAGAMYFFTSTAQGQKPPAEEDPSRAKYKTKADVVTFVKKSVEDGAAAIKAKGDKGLADWITDPDSKQQMHISDLAYGLIDVLTLGRARGISRPISGSAR